jgi:uncharacterized protein YndB with AHSA1/START domain
MIVQTVLSSARLVEVRMRKAVLFLMAVIAAAPARAEVTVSDQGFSVRNSAIVAAPPAQVWAALVQPSRYWNPAHSYSGSGSNLSLEPRAGGCFCETLPEGGSVEHLRVTMVQPNRLLRLSGALGPLGSEGLAGALTWQLEAAEGGTRLTQTYVVGGNMRFERATIAPAVDGVLREQLERLTALFARRP